MTSLWRHMHGRLRLRRGDVLPSAPGNARDRASPGCAHCLWPGLAGLGLSPRRRAALNPDGPGRTAGGIVASVVRSADEPPTQTNIANRGRGGTVWHGYCRTHMNHDRARAERADRGTKEHATALNDGRASDAQRDSARKQTPKKQTRRRTTKERQTQKKKR